MYTLRYVYRQTCMRLYVHAYMNLCIYVCRQIYICTCIHITYMHVYMYMYLCKYGYMYIDRHAWVCFVCMYVNTHILYIHMYVSMYVCICHKANSLGCCEVNSDELGGPFCCFTILVLSHFAMFSFNRCGSFCPYMVGV